VSGDSAGTSAVASETPAASVETSIAKPTELKAVYEKAVTLTWNASATSDIDGNKLFRSETKGKDYKKIGQTTKKILTFLDATVATDKTYYYVVRAYKGSGQSASSNEASITVSASAGNGDTALSAEESMSNDAAAPTKNYVMWILVIAALVLTLVLLILIKRRQDKAKRAKAANPPRH
jgi:preprotein translocase subunit SecG